MSITSGASGTGNGVVQVAVTANPNQTERTGTLTIAGQTVAVREDAQAPCSVEISPDRASFTEDEATGNFEVRAPQHCQWSAAPGASWLTVTSGSPGSGNGAVAYSIMRNRDSTSRIGTIAVGERIFTVTQAGDSRPLCTYSLSTTLLSFGAAGGSMPVAVTTPDNCSWTAESDRDWISISPTSRTGTASVQITVGANSAESVRTGTATVAGQTVSIRQDGTTPPPPPPCTYTLSPVELVFGSAGGSGNITVTTAGHCAWTATDDRDWLTIANGASGTGSGTVRVTAAANPTGALRTGAVTIAGQTVSVKQDALAPCTIDIAPASASYSKNAATGNIAVTAPAHCQWTATAGVPWITVTSGQQGTGSGTIAYSVAANTTPLSRNGAIAIANRTFQISQQGDIGSCEYLVQPVDLSACMTALNLTVSVTTQAGCTWTAAPDAPWITLLGGQSGTGSGVVTFRLGDNYDAPRQGTVMVRWPTATAGQNVRVSQAGCRYGVSTNSISIGGDGGTGRFDVLQQSDPTECGGALQDRCVWTAESDVPWITITTSMPRMGDNPVSFTVAPNPGGARIGTIRVRDKVVQIIQAAR